MGREALDQAEVGHEASRKSFGFSLKDVHL